MLIIFLRYSQSCKKFLITANGPQFFISILLNNLKFTKKVKTPSLFKLLTLNFQEIFLHYYKKFYCKEQRKKYSSRIP